MDVNEKNLSGITPLLWCIPGENLEIVKLLLKDMRVDINRLDDNNWTPLHYASGFGKLDVIKWMIAIRGGMDPKRGRPDQLG